MKPEESSMSMTLLLERVVLLIDTKLPWVCNTVGYLFKKKDIHFVQGDCAYMEGMVLYLRFFFFFFIFFWFSSSLANPIEGIFLFVRLSPNLYLCGRKIYGCEFS